MSELTARPVPVSVSADEVREWLRDRVAAHTGRPVEEIRPDLPLTEYGLDSVYVLGLCAEIEDHYGIEVEPTVMWDNPALDPLAEALVPLITAH
ncbi:acyl carrier protein [Streptomyces prunicolor]|uniref:acyl carrier protein n=1 Tax=Streptomyces TaxID=1883 RepID=UPI00035C2905|nr:acyl carrier protein [Streptomyces hokutonensis]